MEIKLFLLVEIKLFFHTAGFVLSLQRRKLTIHPTQDSSPLDDNLAQIKAEPKMIMMPKYYKNVFLNWNTLNLL